MHLISFTRILRICFFQSSLTFPLNTTSLKSISPLAYAKSIVTHCDEHNPSNFIHSRTRNLSVFSCYSEYHLICFTHHYKHNASNFIHSHTQNFVFSVKFDLDTQYDWIAATIFAMAFDLVAISVFRILMLWIFPQITLVIVLLVLTVGSVLFGTFCGDDITADGDLVLLTCSLSRI